MSISMQGNWTVDVKSKSAAFPQRFKVAGAASGNGTYTQASPPQPVAGDHWTITIEHKPTGKPWRASDDQITFPTLSGGVYRFDIQSNDSGSDSDFNDFVLTCSSPVGFGDHLVYGNVSSYSGLCLRNPCRPRWVVIDDLAALLEVRKNPILAGALRKHYPDLLEIEASDASLESNAPAFRPAMLPLASDYLTPPKQASHLRKIDLPTKKKGESAEAYEIAATFEVTQPQAGVLGYDRVDLGKLYPFPICRTKTLAGAPLGFEEYDRSAAELAGGPYTGDGKRQTLGQTVTDRNGNYIFRFSFFHVTSTPFIAGPGGFGQIPGDFAFTVDHPDVIAQVLDSEEPLGYVYETPPHWNVKQIRRIDICMPESSAPTGPLDCEGAEVIQAVGDIFMTTPNVLDADGRVTTVPLLGEPNTECAAWAGNLALYCCFPETVKKYKIEHRRTPAEPWKLYEDPYSHPTVANPLGESVGPVGGFYTNIEVDASKNWVTAHIQRRAIIRSTVHAAAPGPFFVRVRGYSNGNVLLAQDTVTLYVDNTGWQSSIASVSIGANSGGDCALFDIPAAQPSIPLTVKFRARQNQGFLNRYNLGVRKGNTSGFQIQPTPNTPNENLKVSRGFEDPIRNCQFVGTPNHPQADPGGFVEVDIVPVNPQGWLAPDQPFCTFAVQLGTSMRVTNGKNSGVSTTRTNQYLLGMQQEAPAP